VDTTIWTTGQQFICKQLGRIAHGRPATTNIGFGGDDRKTLYFTSRNHLGSVRVKVPGTPVPTPRKSPA
jgi:sugar lactone lactonase YvrE